MALVSVMCYILCVLSRYPNPVVEIWIMLSGRFMFLRCIKNIWPLGYHVVGSSYSNCNRDHCAFRYGSLHHPLKYTMWNELFTIYPIGMKYGGVGVCGVCGVGGGGGGG